MSAPSSHPTPADRTGPTARTAAATAYGARAGGRPTGAAEWGGGPSADPPGSGGRLGYLSTVLVVVTAVPVAALIIPNTVSYIVRHVIAQLGGQVSADELLRMSGLALPALMIAVPVVAAVAQRVPAWIPLVAGLAVIGGAEILAGYADSPLLVGAVRFAEGAGAGAVLPATAVLVWEQRRGRLLGALWAGLFTGSFLVAMPLALGALAGVAERGWQTVLQPVPALIGVALAAALVRAVIWHRAERPPGGSSPLPAVRRSERTQLLLPLVPAAGFAFLAVATTYGWSPAARLIVAGLGGLGLLGMAIVGTRAVATSSPVSVAVVVITVGLLAFPVAAPLVGLLSLSGGVEGVSPTPFVIGGVLAVVGALVMAGVGRAMALWGVLAGHAVAAVAVLLLSTAEPASPQWSLVPALGLLGLGLGTALAGAVRGARLTAVLFGVSLAFPAVLTGHLVVGALQLARVRTALAAGGDETGVAAAFIAGYRGWITVAAVSAVVLAVVVALTHRRGGAEPPAAAAAPVGARDPRRHYVPPARPAGPGELADQGRRRTAGAGTGETGGML